MTVGVIFARNFLIFMSCDPEILDMATTYLTIYFFGMPIMMVYNFAASLLRAAGDTRRPLIYLAIGGVVNVALNIFFVTVLKMTVEGVATATIISQFLSSTLCIIALIRNPGYAKLELKYLKIDKSIFLEIAKVAIPSALQSFLFSLSNIFIQNKINSFGKFATAGNTAAIQFDGIIFNIGHAVSMSCMSFVSQNMGAKKMDRIKDGILYSLLICFVLQFSTGILAAIFAKPLCSIIVSTEEALNYAVKRLVIMASFYFLCNTMEVFSFSIRAMGKNILPLIVTVMGATVLRIVFLEVAFIFFPFFETIFVTYAISWLFTNIAYAIITPIVYKKVKIKVESTI